MDGQMDVYALHGMWWKRKFNGWHTLHTLLGGSDPQCGVSRLTMYCAFPTTSRRLMKNFALASIGYLRGFLLFSALCTGMQNAIVSTEFAI